MTQIKVKFRPSAVDGREGTIYYQLTIGREVRRVQSGYRVRSDEWDEKGATVKVPQCGKRAATLLTIRKGVRHGVERLARIAKRIEDEGLPYSADDVVAEYGRFVHDFSLFNFMEGAVAKMKANGKVRTAEAYKSTLLSFRKFRHGEDVMLGSLDSAVMEGYEAWLSDRGLTQNSISFYNRVLRAVYNRAVESGGFEDRKPFRHVYCGVGKTVKRALTLSTIREIKELDLQSEPAMDFARDMFLMSFYLRGMSLVDMALLRKSDLRDGYVTYCRHKTGQRLTIKWTTEMQAILRKYPANETDYLLPIIRKPCADERCAYRNAGYNINHSLKRIAQRVGVTIPLTLYVARHSWASAAKAKGVPLGVISEGMGHDSERTTRIYLASLDTRAVDEANELIIGSL